MLQHFCDNWVTGELQVLAIFWGKEIKSPQSEASALNVQVCTSIFAYTLQATRSTR
jgi:hypothetical protein